jgi:hypothetical protein
MIYAESSSGGKLQPYQRLEVWENNIERIKEGYTPEGRKQWDEFLETMKKRRLSNRPIQWIRKPKEKKELKQVSKR